MDKASLSGDVEGPTNTKAPDDAAPKSQPYTPPKSPSTPSKSTSKTSPLSPTATGDLFPETLPGWDGYIDWEGQPDLKAAANRLLAAGTFSAPPEFQLVPLPTTNPVLKSPRWAEYHAALRTPWLRAVPARSWATVVQEKAADMIHLLEFPYNGETPAHAILDTPTPGLTETRHHFVRNHGGIPSIAPAAWFVDIDGLVHTPAARLTLAQLQACAPAESRTVTIQCSGTRRREQIEVYPGDGDEEINAPWGEGAIGTAVWTGVSLKRVLKALCGGVAPGGAHVELTGADTYFKKRTVQNYVVSVPYSKVRAHEVLLAWAMNGEPLPAAHGAPVRVVVFGYIGARSVKWLRRIRVLPAPSVAPVQRTEYLYYGPQAGKQNTLYSNGIVIQEMPVSSAIMAPVQKAVVVHDGAIDVAGWAYSGGSRWVERVDVSPDGGFTWYEVPPAQLSVKRQHTWRMWRMRVPCEAEGWVELCVRCWDNALNTQPTYVRSAWNWDLHVTSSAHRVKVYSVNTSRELTRRRLKVLEERGEKLEPVTRPLEFELESLEEWRNATEVLGPGGVVEVRDVDMVVT
ncbi:Oxidoreductase, molybdopterin-binding domain-containing protein [Geopyxis carbonaria]|nr:Oxidoreductase, molybdopterin-binding domain-containing protein [Geopyxis carbonaria]